MAFRALVITTAAAPSFSVEELPAVHTPAKTGLRLASFSRVVSERGFSSQAYKDAFKANQQLDDLIREIDRLEKNNQTLFNWLNNKNTDKRDLLNFYERLTGEELSSRIHKDTISIRIGSFINTHRLDDSLRGELLTLSQIQRRLINARSRDFRGGRKDRR